MRNCVHASTMHGDWQARAVMRVQVFQFWHSFYRFVGSKLEKF